MTRKRHRVVGTTREGTRVAADVEWRGRTDFAEFAEALDIPSDLVLAVNPQHDKLLGTRLFVVFSRPADETLLYTAWLARGADGVLVVMGEPEPHPRMWDEIVRRMEEQR